MSDIDQGPLDKLFVEKNKILLIVLSICPCSSFVMLILSLICFLTAKRSESKALAKLLLIIAAVLFVASFVISFMSGGFAMIMGGAR